jgi:hypothetical protein
MGQVEQMIHGQFTSSNQTLSYAVTADSVSQLNLNAPGNSLSFNLYDAYGNRINNINSNGGNESHGVFVMAPGQYTLQVTGPWGNSWPAAFSFASQLINTQTPLAAGVATPVSLSWSNGNPDQIQTRHCLMAQKFNMRC